MNKNANNAQVEKEPKSTGSKVSLIVGIVLCAILLPILIINCALIIKGFTNADEPPSLFGYTPMIVLTDSMEPLINVGDIIISKDVDVKNIKEGDIISFKDPMSSSGAILTHRVVGFNEDGKAITAGDHNVTRDYERDLFNANQDVKKAQTALDNGEEGAQAKLDTAKQKLADLGKKWDESKDYPYYEGHYDTEPVELTDKVIVGKYTSIRIPFVGNISMFMQTTWGWVICIALPLVAFIAYELITRKKKDKGEAKNMDALLAELEALKAAKAAEEATTPDAAGTANENSSTDDTPKEN